MKIQLVSDVHIEMYRDEIDPMTFVEPTGDYLALCGDIGSPGNEKQCKRYKKLLETYSQHFKHVFVLTGNHEYYAPGFKKPGESKPTVAEIDTLINNICKAFDNVTFLQMKSVIIEGVKIIGATLWSEVTNVPAVAGGLNDYRMIYVENEDVQPKKKKQRTLQVPDTCAWHKEHLEYILKEIKSAREENMPCVVFSHHCPVYEQSSHPKYITSPIYSAFATDLKHMFESKEFDHVKLWGYGHTHYNASRIVGKTLIEANQKGYFFEKELGGPFKANHCITIE